VLVATDVAARGLDMTVDLVIQTKPPVTASGRTDFETYVHRSGRTGRAGRKGICVTLFTPKFRHAVVEIEAAVGNRFEWLGAPQPGDIVAAATTTVLEDVADVDNTVFPLFEEAANKLIEDMGPVEALSAALAVITGHTKPLRSRSLLSNSDDFVTCQFLAGRPIQVSRVALSIVVDRGPQRLIGWCQAVGYVWTALRRVFPMDVTEAIRGMQLTADGEGAVFDVPAQYMPLFREAIPENAPTLQICTVLPALRERAGGAGGNGGGGFGFGNKGFGFRGGRGEFEGHALRLIGGARTNF
jgi:ATP-dependent RNA helicase DDX21